MVPYNKLKTIFIFTVELVSIEGIHDQMGNYNIISWKLVRLHVLYMPICLAHKKYFIVGLWCETQNKDLAHCNIKSNQKTTVFKCC